MNRALPPSEFLREFRELLDETAYSSQGLPGRIGSAWPPPDEDTATQMMLATRDINAANTLVRLFLLGSHVDHDICAEFLPGNLFEQLQKYEILKLEHDRVVASVVIIPVDEFLFVSDTFQVLGESEAREFVLPASTHAGNFLKQFTERDEVQATLDLGCGCGLHALFAAKHSAKVVATDISERAIYYTALNAEFNGMRNIETRLGSLFEAVTGESFDLIVCNPPFVVTPGKTFVYRDNEMVLDEFCRFLVGEAHHFLRDGGKIQLLCEWVELSSESWQGRIVSWIKNCDAWILHPHPVSAAEYVAARSRDISANAAKDSSVESWLAYFDTHGVQNIHSGLLTLRKRDGRNWIGIHDVNERIDDASVEIVKNGFAACEFLEVCDNESLQQALLYRRENPTSSLKLDENVSAYVAKHDGTETVAECIDAFMNASGDQSASLAADLLAMTRTLISSGFLTPLEPARTNASAVS